MYIMQLLSKVIIKNNFRKLGLPVNRKIPMIGMVTRLVEAKGLDLVTRILDELLEYENVQFVILGTGDRQYEDWFKGLVWRYPKKYLLISSLIMN